MSYTVIQSGGTQSITNQQALYPSKEDNSPIGLKSSLHWDPLRKELHQFNLDNNNTYYQNIFIYNLFYKQLLKSNPFLNLTTTFNMITRQPNHSPPETQGTCF